MTPAHADQLIEAGATDLISKLSLYLPPGPVRDRLAPYSQGLVSMQDENMEQQRTEHALQERERAEPIVGKQELIRIGTFEQALNKFYSLEEETWPELPLRRRDWIAGQISQWFIKSDLNRSIVHHGDGSWSQPIFLETALKITDRYSRRIATEQHLAISLKAWAFPPVSNYFRRFGFSPDARRELIHLLTDRTLHRDVLTNVLGFVESAHFSWPAEIDDLTTIVNDHRIESHNQVRAMHLLISRDVGDAELRTLLASSNSEVRNLAFGALVDRQDRGTISRELSRLRDNLATLRSAEVPPPNESPAAWITKIRQNWAWDDLRELRRLTLEHRLPYLCDIVTRTLYGIDPAGTPTLIQTQLRLAPEEWRARQATLVEEYDRARQFDTARNTTFERVLEKLKTSTSLITLKIWVEGKTDLPVYDKLLREAGQVVLAETLDVVGGWPMLSSRPRSDGSMAAERR